MKTANILLWFSLSALCLAACSDDSPSNTQETPSEGLNINANSLLDGWTYTTDYAIPHLNPDNYYAEHTVKYNGKEILNYALEWADDKKHAAWVAYSFDEETCKKNVNRTNAWMPDPQLPDGMSPDDNDHRSDGFDRGHLCASEDRVYSKSANEQTFYYSNISPQMTSFNGGYWVTFEKIIQDWARSGRYQKLYIAKGGTLNQLLTNYTGTRPAEDGQLPATDANGLTRHGLACPKYYFAAVLAKQSDGYQSIGFLVEHRDDYGYNNDHQAPVSVVKNCALSIDELEKATGLDFFCNLPDEIENRVESLYNEADWDFAP